MPILVPSTGAESWQRLLEFHIEGLKMDGEPVPKPSSSVEFVEVAA